MTAPLDPAALFERLHEADVAYIVIGGFAVIAHGVQRSTADLDICPAPDSPNLERLASLLQDLEARHVGIGDLDPDEHAADPTEPSALGGGRNFRLETSLGALDIIQWIPGIADGRAFPELAEGAITAEVRGIPVSVCSRAHLLAMKRTSDRPIDRADLDQLEGQVG